MAASAASPSLSGETPLTPNLLDWDEAMVNTWLESIGFAQYHQQILEHGISGEIISLLDHDGLKEIGVHTVGQRLTILKEVYYLKVRHGVPVEPEHYVPPSEVIESASQERVSLDRLHELILELRDRTQVLEKDNRRLAESLSNLVEKIHNESSEVSIRQINPFQPGLNGHTTSGVHRHHEVNFESPQSSPQRQEHDVSSSSQPARPPKTIFANHSADAPRSAIDRPHPHSQPQRQSSTGMPTTPRQFKDAKDSLATPPTTIATSSTTNSTPADNQFKSFKVSLEDPCWKVLPAALKKYKINDDWRKYVMFICHGSTERCLSYDEKPLLLFQKLKDNNKNPVFMLRHIKDIRSPISVAQQKQVARQQQLSANAASTSIPISSPAGQSKPANGNGTGTTTSPSTSAAATNAYSRNTRLHQPPVLHPISAQAQANAAAAAAAQIEEDSTPPPAPHPNVHESIANASAGGGGSAGASGAPGGGPGAMASYAIAIYPYTAEQEDEFDVAVDDTFIIRSREKGWWVVQRDVAGTGVPSTNLEDQPKWIPAGCLLETILAPAQAIAETRALQSSSPSNVTPSLTPTTSPTTVSSSVTKPILPSQIISTSFPGITLMPYEDKGEYELTLNRGEVLRVFKRYNHWSYAIKEETGERGWVPSWFIGKYTPGSTILPSLVPPTPTTSTSNATNGSGSNPPPHQPPSLLPDISAHDGGGGGGSQHLPAPASSMNPTGANGSSPMSQAFPAGSSTAAGAGTGTGYIRSAVPLV